MRKTLIIILIILLVLVAAAIAAVTILGGSVTVDQDTEVKIEEGSSSTSIGQTLVEAGLIKNAQYFRIYAKMNKIDDHFKAGSYSFEAGKWSLEEVCDILVLGAVSTDGQVRVTIREGLSVKETAQLLVNSGLGSMENYLDYAANGDFSQYDYIPGEGTEIEPATRLEGFLFPDTYLIDPEWTEQQIFDMLLAQFATVLVEHDYAAKAAAKDMTVYQLITMASIVEKEAQVADDRPLIAGVFYNRLAIDMQLESCATVQFILGEPKYPLLYSDIAIDNPYNTYKNPGLPPGPIACPGTASIDAALEPAEHDYLYFKAQKDGSHRFSTTYAEHMEQRENDQ